MKKAKFLAMLLLFFGAGLTMSCGGDDDEDDYDSGSSSNPVQNLIGTWTYSGNGMSASYTFKSDYTGSGYQNYTNSRNNFTFTWSIAGNKVKWEGTNKWTASGDSGTDWIGGEFTYDGNTLSYGSTVYKKR